MRNAYAMRQHSVALRILLTVLPEPLSECVIATLSFCGNGKTDMAKVQILTAMTLDGFLPEADGKFMQWVKTSSKGFPYWQERSTFRIRPGHPMLDLACDKERTSDSCIYIAEVSDCPGVELLGNLFRFHLIDELVIYLLPIMAGTGTSLFKNPPAGHWHLRKTDTFSNGICRMVYRRILQ